MQNRLDLYKKTVDILYAAYFNDTLRHGYCSACAVGNLIAANSGCEMNNIGGWLEWIKGGRTRVIPEWGSVFSTDPDDGVQDMNKAMYFGGAKEQIDSTGYDIEDLALIEASFEKANKGSSKEDYMFNGLVAVLEALKQIHGIDDNQPEVTRFKDHYATLTHS